TVNPFAYVNAMTRIFCDGVPFTITPTHNVDGTIAQNTSFSWTVQDSGGLGGVNPGSGTSLSATLTNPGATQLTAVYQFTPNVPGCGSGLPFTVTVTINPNAEIAPFTATTCANVVFSVTPTLSAPNVVPFGTTYAWSAPVANGFTNTASASGQPTITGNLLNTVNEVRTATYLVTPTSSGGCLGAQFSVTVTVNPIAQITTMTAVICSGDTFILTPTHGVSSNIIPALTSFYWGNPTTTGGLTWSLTQIAPGVATISGTLSNSTHTVQTATYTILSTLSNGCTNSAPFTVIVTVNPRPTISTITTTTCEGVVFTVSPVVGTNGVNGTVPAGTLYSWIAPTFTSSISGGQAQSAFVSSITGTVQNNSSSVQTITYQVVPRSAGSCVGATFTVNVGVFPNASITGMSTTICSGLPFRVTPVDGVNGMVPSTPLVTTYAWSTPSSSFITGAQSRSGVSDIFGTLNNTTNVLRSITYTVVPTSTNNCQGSAFSVVVNVNPIAAINSMTAVTCSGIAFTATPTNGSNGIVPDPTIYRWNTPSPIPTGLTPQGITTGLSASNITGTWINTTNQSITVTYFVTPTSVLCGDGAMFSLVTTIAPVPAISSTTIATCALLTFTTTPTNGSYNGTLGNIVPATTTYSWPAPVNANIGGLVASSGSPTSISGYLTNLVNTALTATYVVTPSATYASPIAGSCQGLP
ncbi:MAG: PKD-like domain-containing protein, partial [Bacteroidota bacterium]